MSLIVATHNGKFHADESLAIAILKRLSDYKDAKVVRTRDAEVLKTAAVVVDVGGEYDTATHRYDHHQPTFKDTFSPAHNTRLSSAGLVYKHFGLRLLQEHFNLPDLEAKVAYDRIYERFIEAFDGVDNGVERFEKEVGEARYCKMRDMADIVNDFNPVDEKEDADVQFLKAVEFVGQQLDRYVQQLIAWWLPGRPLVLQALSATSERYLVFPGPVAWKEHLFALEKENGTEGNVLYVIYPDTVSGTFRVQAVPEKEGSFICRKALPKEWRGLRDAELEQASGVEGGIFVHVTGLSVGTRPFKVPSKWFKKLSSWSETISD